MPAESGASQKGVNKDYCFRHAQMYEGWECPLCAREKAQGAHSSPGSGGGGGGGAAAGGGPATADAPPTAANRPASRARSEEAGHLLNAGAAREALAAAERAIDLDRSNLHAYTVAARAADRLGELGRQEGFLEEAARLLRDPEYRRTSDWYLELLRATRDAAMARPIVASFIAAGPWPSADTSDVILALLQRDIPGEALRLIDSIPPEHRSLTICSYGAQLTARTFSVQDPDIAAYLGRVPAANRERVLSEFKGMCEDNTFPIQTLMMVRDSVRARHREWKAEIHQLQVAEARKAATERLQPETTKPGVSFAVRFAGITLGASLVLAVVVGSAVLLFLGIVLALVAGVLGFVYGRNAELERRLPELVPGLVEEMAREEVDRWQVVLDDQSPLFPSVRPEEAAAPPAATSEEVEPAAAAAGQEAPPQAAEAPTGQGQD